MWCGHASWRGRYRTMWENGYRVLGGAVAGHDCAVVVIVIVICHDVKKVVVTRLTFMHMWELTDDIWLCNIV